LDEILAEELPHPGDAIAFHDVIQPFLRRHERRFDNQIR